MTVEAIYSGIEVVGDDAFDFLQAQLSNDLRLLEGRDVLLCAWCNPKGRVICLLRVTATRDGYLLTLPQDLIETLVNRLTMFRFRARVELARRECSLDAIGVERSVDDWRLENLRAGIPEIGAAQSERFTAHMLNLDLLDAVSLDKGCYPGQEIIARTHYRGASKRRLLRFEATAPVSAGDEVFDGERKVGDVVNAIGTDLLAVVPIDRKYSPLTAAGVALAAKKLPYM